jgi:hypothetical protein
MGSARFIATGSAQTKLGRATQHKSGLERLALVAVAVAIGGCAATSYKSRGLGGGYSETKISDTEYVVSFDGNGLATRTRVHYFWVYRCAQLTLKQGYSLYVLKPPQAESRSLSPDSGVQPAVYRQDRGGSIVKTGGGVFIFIPVPANTSPQARWTYSGTISMFNKPLSRQQPWAIDAQEVVNVLKPYIASNGSIEPPAEGYLLMRAFLAHTRVSFGPDISVSALAAGASGQAASAEVTSRGASRSVDEITEKVEEAGLVRLHAMYLDDLRYLKHPFGDVVLTFSIGQDGLVSDCHATSSSIDNDSFSTTVENVVRKTQFGFKAGSSIAVSNFRISFDVPEARSNPP